MKDAMSARKPTTPSQETPTLPGGEFLLYITEDGHRRIQVRLDGQTVWMTLKGLADLYQTTPSNISQHIANIYEEGELTPEATVKHYLTVQMEGQRQVRRDLAHYHLDMILAVGYRVRSSRGTQFRQWATGRLSEFLVKGFTLDDQRLKDGRDLGQDYFDELLERIRDIRASERRFYQKITDIYARCSVDYDSHADLTHTFYATVQNKLHWAIHHHTAAELIQARADASKPNMGLTTWQNAPAGRIRKHDAGVAKNYLTEDELKALNRIVTMYLDYAEEQASRRQAMTMRDWADKLDAFLQFNERDVLKDAGRMTAELAQRLAEEQFEQYQARQRLQEAAEPSSDFDRAVEDVKRLGSKIRKA
jgi:hypothetical protein